MLRRYGRSEFFLRVSVREENLEKLRHDKDIDMGEVSHFQKSNPRNR